MENAWNTLRSSEHKGEAGPKHSQIDRGKRQRLGVEEGSQELEGQLVGITETGTILNHPSCLMGQELPERVPP